MIKPFLGPSVAQVAALIRLKERLSERGYLIASVHPKYRRHASDFVIIPNDYPQQFSIVRAANKFIVVRSFGVRRNDITEVIKQLREKSPAPLMHAMPLLPYMKGRANLWRHFVDPSQHYEIELLQRVKFA